MYLSSSDFNLHSTVVLLKAESMADVRVVLSDLHSTVVLLKEEGRKNIYGSINIFTFYCSSIKGVVREVA